MLGKKERTQYIRAKYGSDFSAFESCDPRIPYTVREKGSKTILAVAIGLCTSKDGLLCYYDFERGHMLRGKAVKKLKNGIVFQTAIFKKPLVFEPLTLEEFEREFKPTLPNELAQRLNSLDDVYVWYRKEAGMV